MQVERAAAPGEPVVVDSRLLDFVLRRRNSEGLGQQVVLLKEHAVPERLSVDSGEWILVTVEDDRLLPALRAEGFVVMPDALQAATIDAGSGFALPGGRVVRIYYVVRP